MLALWHVLYTLTSFSRDSQKLVQGPATSASPWQLVRWTNPWDSPKTQWVLNSGGRRQLSKSQGALWVIMVHLPQMKLHCRSPSQEEQSQSVQMLVESWKPGIFDPNSVRIIVSPTKKRKKEKKITNFLVNFPNGFSNLYHMQSIKFSKTKYHSWDLKKRGIEDHTWEKKFLSFLLWKKYNTY